MNLLLFNPESDYALAVNSPYYTPPAPVIKLRRELALLPVFYALEGDIILLLDDFSDNELKSLPYYEITEKRGVKIMVKNIPENITGEIEDIIPWGWNRAIHHTLSLYLPNSAALPSLDFIEKVRELSHRKRIFQFRELLKQSSEGFVFPETKEITLEDDLDDFIRMFDHVYFKAPWSSSGRGVINTANMTSGRIREWCHGCIRSQGSVIAEEGLGRTGDFATEWFINDGNPVFLGLSFFEVSKSGSYGKNIVASQEVIFNKIKSLSPFFNENVIRLQREVLKETFAPYYDGPVGIDMLSTCDGLINPCVEINLRMTMGHVAYFQNQFFTSES